MAELTPERVRELLDYSTPGTWTAGSDWIAHSMDPFALLIQGGLAADEEHTGWDLEIMAAAPDLARLVLEQAEELERLRARPAELEHGDEGKP